MSGTGACSRDERSRKRCERSGEQGDGAGPEQRRNRSRDERAELVWDALEKELRKRRKEKEEERAGQHSESDACQETCEGAEESA